MSAANLRAVERDRGPDSADYVFDLGAANELAVERREPLLSVFADDDEPLGDVLDLDAALGRPTIVDEEPDTERTPSTGLT